MDEIKVRCTKTRDHRFIKGKVYGFDKTGRFVDEFGSAGNIRYTGDFERWYRACSWCDYAFEPVKDLRTVVIHTDGEATTAILKDGKTVVKKATAKCSAGDKFDFNIGARLAFDRLMEEDKPAHKLYNGKVICVDNPGCRGLYTVGKVYSFKDGKMVDDVGIARPMFSDIESFADWVKYSSSKFIEYKGGL